MKRPLLLLALPLILAAITFGVKWRADNPTPTKEDLEIRALMSKLPTAEFFHTPPRKSALQMYHVRLSKRELKPFIDCVFMSSHSFKASKGMSSKYGTVGMYIPIVESEKHKLKWALINISLDNRMGQIITGHTKHTNAPMETNLHPTTTKRWLELLLANPRIGPELRARLNR